MRETVFALFLLAAGSLVTAGCAVTFGNGIGLIVGGALLAPWSWAVLSGDSPVLDVGPVEVPE